MAREQSENSDFLPNQSPGFMTTRWSLVVSSCNNLETSQAALTELCESYWKPVFVFIKNRGYNRDDALDLTQNFFLRLLEKKDLNKADPSIGRFRSFLLGAVKHFLLNEMEKAGAQKRGGDKILFSLDSGKTDDSDKIFHIDLPCDLTPDKIFAKEWTETLLNAVLNELKNIYEQEGKSEIFEQLNGQLVSDRKKTPYKDIADKLKMSEGAVKVAAHRLRKRYRRILQEKVAETVANPADVEDEIRSMISALEK